MLFNWKSGQERHQVEICCWIESLVKRDTKVEICCWTESLVKRDTKVEICCWTESGQKRHQSWNMLLEWKSGQETPKLKYVVGLKVLSRGTPKSKYSVGMKVWPRGTPILNTPWQSLMSVPLKLILEGKGSLVCTFFGDIKIISVFGLHLTVAYCLSPSPSSESRRHPDFVTEAIISSSDNDFWISSPFGWDHSIMKNAAMDWKGN